MKKGVRSTGFSNFSFLNVLESKGFMSTAQWVGERDVYEAQKVKREHKKVDDIVVILSGKRLLKFAWEELKQSNGQ